MGSSLVNVKSERQACRLEPQAGADPDLEAEFLPPPGSLRFCSKGLWLTGWGNHSVESDLLYLGSDDGCEPHSQNTFTATSRWVFSWITWDWPSQADTQNWPSLYLTSFLLSKIPTFVLLLLTLESTWICIEVHYIWGAKSSREKGISFKYINM